MQITPSATKVDAPGGAPELPDNLSEPWQNPAAAAALKISTQMLQQVRDGIEINYDAIDRVRGLAGSLDTAGGIFSDANSVLAEDGNDMNDSFIPLIDRATSNVNLVATRLQSKEINDTWRDERQSLLDAVKSAMVISQTVGEQLDPRQL